MQILSSCGRMSRFFPSEPKKLACQGLRGRKYRGSLFAVKYIGKWKLQLAAEVTVGSGRAISKEDVA